MQSFRLISKQGAIVAVFELPDTEGYIVGRMDDASDFQPDINLTPYEAREHGVSRRHVAIVAFRGQPHIVDLNSVNGTYLNDKRLLPDTPYPITQTDELRFGTLTLSLEKGDLAK